MSIWTISRESDGVHADAIMENGMVVLHLQPGTVRNEQNVERIVMLLNVLTCVEQFIEKAKNAT